ncbi:MAG: DMT family transporter [Phormidesmis sp. RL_2_1]|nr:DMT family transporter [Phormidesmis sp. RL_2_1]
MKNIANIREPKLSDFIMLLTLGGALGSSFLFTKIGVETIPPFTLVTARLTFAAIVLAIYMKITSSSIPKGVYIWKYFLLLGIFANIIPFVLITWSEIFIDSGLASIFMALIPMFTSVTANFVTEDERLNTRKILGLAIGFSGILILFGSHVLDLGNASQILPKLACLLAAFCYAFSRILTRKLYFVPPVTTSMGVLVCASVISIPISLIVDKPWLITPSPSSIFAVLCLSLICTSFAYIILYRLIAEVGATFMTTMNYLVPMFGILWGVIFLGESPKVSSIVATAVIFSGLAVMNSSKKVIVEKS